MVSAYHFVCQFATGALSGFVAGYVGGDIGIRLRDRHNASCPRDQQMRNNWGDTEGMYHVFYTFFIGIFSGILFPIVSNFVSSSLLSTLLVASFAAGTMGYCTFHTI